MTESPQSFRGRATVAIELLKRTRTECVTWRCMGCNQHRYSTLGSKGAGVWKRCSHCVAKGKAHA